MPAFARLAVLTLASHSSRPDGTTMAEPVEDAEAALVEKSPSTSDVFALRASWRQAHSLAKEKAAGSVSRWAQVRAALWL